jgi:hypothetical protein
MARPREKIEMLRETVQAESTSPHETAREPERAQKRRERRRQEVTFPGREEKRAVKSGVVRHERLDALLGEHALEPLQRLDLVRGVEEVLGADSGEGRDHRGNGPVGSDQSLEATGLEAVPEYDQSDLEDLAGPGREPGGLQIDQTKHDPREGSPLLCAWARVGRREEPLRPLRKREMRGHAKGRA